MKSFYATPASLLKELIAIPSVNPTDKNKPGGIYGDDAIADFIHQWIQNIGIDVEIQHVADGCHNTIAYIPGVDQQRTTVLCAHMDTVDVEAMEIEPFTPEEKQNRIYGRGSCDDKASLASMMMALKNVVSSSVQPPHNIIFLATGGEEFNMAGSEHFIKTIDRRIDSVVIGEPTKLRLISTHKGGLRQEIITRGVSVHSSTPALGVNPIYKMAKIINAVECFAGKLLQETPHPLLNTETIVCSIVNAGQQSNTIPAECKAVIDWRILPGKKKEKCLEELYDFIKQETKETFEFSKTIFTSPMETENSNYMIKKMLDINKAFVDQREPDGAFYGTDASKFYLQGIPGIVIGPGDIKEAHTKDEFVEIDQLSKAVKLYNDFIFSL